MASAKQLAANRQNAQHSTGPKTDQGKAQASRNNTSHGLFCRDLVIDTENEAEFKNFRDEFLKSLRPQDLLELALVDQMVAVKWRLRRAAAAESHWHNVRAQQMQRQNGAHIKRLTKQIDTTGYYAPKEDEKIGLRATRDRLAAQRTADLQAAVTSSILTGSRQNLERLSRYEQRLSNEFHRCLRDLEKLRTSKCNRAELPDSPYREAPTTPVSEVFRRPGSDAQVESEPRAIDRASKIQFEPNSPSCARNPDNILRAKPQDVRP
jgi:hypothetical protein